MKTFITLFCCFLGSIIEKIQQFWTMFRELTSRNHKPYCPECKIRVQEHDLTSHQLEYHDPKHGIFRCHHPYCDHSEIRITEMIDHLWNIHGVNLSVAEVFDSTFVSCTVYFRLQKCPYCFLKTRFLPVLKHHIHIVHADKMLQCHCGH